MIRVKKIAHAVYEMPEAAAFACANGACSVPVFDAAQVHRIVAKVDNR